MAAKQDTVRLTGIGVVGVDISFRLVAALVRVELDDDYDAIRKVARSS